MHVLLEVSACAGDERCEGAAEVAGAFEVAEFGDGWLGVGVDGAREEGDIGGHGGVGPGGAGDCGVERAHVGAERVDADDGFDVVVAVAGDERADDGEFAGEGGEFGEGRAEGDAWDGGGDFAGGAADVRGGVHFGVERFELGGTAVHEEEDDGAVFEGIGGGGSGGGFDGELVGEGEASEGEGAGAEELAALPEACVPEVILERQHRGGS